MKKHSLLSSPKYKRWVSERDRALEELHQRAQLRQTDEMRRALSDALIAAKAAYYELKDHTRPHAIDSLEHSMKSILRGAGDRLFVIYTDLRRQAYVLAKTSEVEILHQHNAKKGIVSKLHAGELAKHQGGESFAGGPMYQRIQMYMDRLGRKIVSTIQTSALNAPDMESFLQDVMSAFPTRKAYKRPPRSLKPLQESDRRTISSGVPDWQQTYEDARAEGATAAEATMLLDQEGQAAWDDMVQAYKNEYIPEWRAPEYVVNIPITDPTIQQDGTEVWYAWEFERDMTNEFVNAVREGQIQGAKDAGITDFVWIAVIDSVTDACCRWRDGLLVSEIKDRLPQHEDEDDSCNLENDGLTPPLHFNCRCTLAPATDNIPDKPDDGAAEFNEWLDT